MQSLLTVILSLVVVCSAQQSSSCGSKESCSACIQEPECVWCITPATADHCSHVNLTLSNLKWCPKDLTINPVRNVKITKNDNFSSEKDKVVQVRPQNVKIRLRRGEEYKLEFQYEQANNYPVDLYYIMDLSYSMKDHKAKLAELGKKLAVTMRNITSNFRLGFGSFVDKVDLPFVSTAPEKLKNPCNGNKQCVSPYSFKNHMALSEDDAKFSKEVNDAQVSGNLDRPEGGFDALMQAMVCNEVIGWRPQARHLIVFSTDAQFHIAGDGKLAGVIEPNDAKCHMESNMYTHDLLLDYPSVSHISFVAKENNKNIIFAIADEKKYISAFYDELKKNIENSNMGKLDAKSDNVVNLVLDNYNKIVDSVTFSTNASNEVKVDITSNCPKSIDRGCRDIHVGDLVHFTATIKPLKCDKNNKEIIAIKPDGLDESLMVELDIICECEECNAASKYFEPNSTSCSNAGNLHCGICDCHKGRFGQKCQCDKSSSDVEGDANCLANVPNAKICSGLGTCRCGRCECNERKDRNEKIYGKYCDCDNYSCKRSEGYLCSNRGTCGCKGICDCDSGWTGDACQCRDTNSTCIKPGDDSICNGHGKCVCGKCECFNDKVKYYGTYCDECPKCDSQRCEDLKNCVECKVHKTGMYNTEECASKCNTTNIEIVDELEKLPNDDVKLCMSQVDENSCHFIYQYGYDMNRKIVVTAKKTKNCTEPADIIPWVVGVIVSILLAGLIALIIWKIWTTIHDRKEYARFEEEKQKSNWHRNENPLYKQATSTFANPAYRRNRRSSLKNRFSFKS